MSLSYSEVIAKFPDKVREVKDYNNKLDTSIIPNDSELYLESTEVHEDNEGNLWILCPKNNMYYELYNKKLDKTYINIFPTIAAEVTCDCKSGLALYEYHDILSEEIDRNKMGEIFHITSNFFTDERDNIWVQSINIIETDNGYDNISGWLIYKNNRNNFANLLIHGKYKVLTTNGEIDEDKILAFKEYLKGLRYTWMYDVTVNPLQLFSKNKKGSVKTGKKKNGEIVNANVKYYSGDKSIEFDVGKRKQYSWKHRKHNAKNISHRAKPIVQNSMSFPKSLGKSSGVYQYDYYMDYKRDGLIDDMDVIRKNLNIDIQSYSDFLDKVTTRYDRFKLANPNGVLSKGFGHVFFTKPDCNFFSDNTGGKLQTKPGKDPNIRYVQAHKPVLLRQLAHVDNDPWAYLLSNQVSSFQLSDESITDDAYGTTNHKHKIAFGRSNEESKSAGSISLEVKDTKELDILELHKLWVEYISNVYHGKWYPKDPYIWKKIIDYAGSCYYIITAEDGETIIFWSKYYGVFPANIPSSSYSWQSGKPIEQTNLNITYKYSFKEDFNPQALVEFNINSNIKPGETIAYESTYNPHLGTTGYTWVGAPFIETCSGVANSDFYFKLRYLRKR